MRRLPRRQAQAIALDGHASDRVVESVVDATTVSAFVATDDTFPSEVVALGLDGAELGRLPVGVPDAEPGSQTKSFTAIGTPITAPSG